MSRHTAPFCLLLAWVCISGCGARTVDPTDTNTNWLNECEDDTDCGGAYECLCSICTLPCDNSAQCVGRPREAQCAPALASCSSATSICQPVIGFEDITGTPSGSSSPSDGGTQDDTTSPKLGAPTADGTHTGTGASSADATHPSNTTGDTGTGTGTDTGTGRTDTGNDTGTGSTDTGTGTGTDTWAVDTTRSACEVDRVGNVGTVSEVCDDPNEVCCTCGCGLPTEGCRAELACMDPAGPPCGVGYCRDEGDVCCDAEAGLCASTAEACPTGVAEEPAPKCVPMLEERFTELNQTNWSGSLELVQQFGGQTKSVSVPVSLRLGDFSLPENALVALGYLSPDWIAVDWTADQRLNELYADQGVGQAYAFRAAEAAGAANPLDFVRSCYNGYRGEVHWEYDVTYALADLVDYTPHAYSEPDAPVVTLLAQERFVLDYRDGEAVLLVEGSSAGEVEGEPVGFSVAGELSRD